MAQTIRIGGAEIAVARDADYRFPAHTALPNVPPEAWVPYLGMPAPAEIESGVFTFVVRSQGKTILVDTGVGPWGLWRFPGGTLLDSLAELDLTPNDIDYVLATHLHLDHIGWNTMPSENGPVPTFPRARYIFQKADWDHFTSPEYLGLGISAAEMVAKTVVPMEHTGLMDLADSEYHLTDEITLLHTPGHTPGSVTVLLQSQGESALLLGDVAHHPVQLTETGWSPIYDIDASLSARSRKAVVEQAKQMDAIVAGPHVSATGPAFGRMVEIEGRSFWRGL